MSPSSGKPIAAPASGSSLTRGLTVAVTGPTGDIGRAFLRELDTTPGVQQVVGMARSPFDPEAEGLTRTEYQQGDILDQDSVARVVEGADVVVHLAFLIWGSKSETRTVNLEGSRNVFTAALDAGVERLVYTSSVAAYGWHDDNPDWLTEDIPPRGTDAHYYSSQKAELEAELEILARGSSTDVYVFRPCIVAGPTALSLVTKIPYVQLGEKLPAPLKKVIDALPRLRPIVPDPGLSFQLIHEADVARALVAAVLGKGTPGVYNLAAEGEITVSDVARALGWYTIPLPDVALDATVKVVSRFPYLPTQAAWLNSIKVPVLMDCTKARKELDWEPVHDAFDTLAATVHAARNAGIPLTKT